MLQRSSLRTQEKTGTDQERQFSATNRFYSIVTIYTPHGNFQRRVDWKYWLRSHGYLNPPFRRLLTWKRFTWRPNPVSDEQAFESMTTAIANGTISWNGGEFYGPPDTILSTFSTST